MASAPQARATTSRRESAVVSSSGGSNCARKPTSIWWNCGWFADTTATHQIQPCLHEFSALTTGRKCVCFPLRFYPHTPQLSSSSHMQKLKDFFRFLVDLWFGARVSRVLPFTHKENQLRSSVAARRPKRSASEPMPQLQTWSFGLFSPPRGWDLGLSPSDVRKSGTIDQDFAGSIHFISFRSCLVSAWGTTGNYWQDEACHLVPLPKLNSILIRAEFLLHSASLAPHSRSHYIILGSFCCI